MAWLRRDSPSDAIGKTLEPFAVSLGLDWLAESERPTDPQFAMVANGASLLFLYADPAGFPSRDAAASKRGSKLLRRAFAHDGGQRASIMLAHALGCFLHDDALSGNRADVAAEVARELDALQERWPLRGYEADLIARSRAEYRTLLYHELRDFGVPPTGYHMSLLDPERGDPDEDPELVDIQLAYAAAYMRRTATLGAIEIALGPADYSSLAPQLSSMNDESLGTGFNDLPAQAKDAEWWNAYVARWAQQGLGLTL